MGDLVDLANERKEKEAYDMGDWLMDLANERKEKKAAEEKKWHEWRRLGIGCSDIPAIMGASPHRTAYDIWLDKMGQSNFDGNFATRKGQEFEPIAREMYEYKTGKQFPPKQVEYGKWPILRGTLDGWNEVRNTLIEIKYVGKKAYEEAKLGIIPAHYKLQIQAQLLCSRATVAVYVAYNDEHPNDIVTLQVLPNEKVQQEILTAAIAFWQYVVTKTPPPTDEMQIEDEVLLENLNKIDKFKTMIKRAEAEIETLEAEVKKHVTTTKATCGGFIMQWIEKKGNVDYKKVPELTGVNLEPYRKETIKYFSIKKDKE